MGARLRLKASKDISGYSPRDAAHLPRDEALRADRRRQRLGHVHQRRDGRRWDNDDAQPRVPRPATPTTSKWSSSAGAATRRSRRRTSASSDDADFRDAFSDGRAGPHGRGANPRPGVSSTRACWTRWRRCRASCSSRKAPAAKPTRIGRSRSGSAQTISQPYIVGYMTEALQARAVAPRARDRHGMRLPDGDARGAGRARLFDRGVPELAARARATLDSLGIHQRRYPRRRRQCRLARGRAVRSHHRRRGAARCRPRWSISSSTEASWCFPSSVHWAAGTRGAAEARGEGRDSLDAASALRAYDSAGLKTRPTAAGRTKRSKCPDR